MVTKETKIEWIGNIPYNWEVIKLRFLGNLKSGLSNKKPDDFGFGYPFLTYKDVYQNYSIPELKELVNSTETEWEINGIKRGDIFFTGSSETIDELGLSSVCLKNIDKGTYNGFCIRFRPANDLLLPEYSKYFFRSHAIREFLVRNDNSVTRTNLSQATLKNVQVIIPPKIIQEKIYKYLDYHFSRLNKIIKLNKDEIELIENYKKSIINEYTMNGIDKNHYKETNLEYLKKIPSNWDLIKIKFIVQKKKERNPGDVEVLSLYREYGIVPKNSRDDNFNVTSEDTSNYKYVEIGDLVVNKMKAWQGSLSISNYEGIVSPAYYVYSFLNDDNNKKYLHYLLRNIFFTSIYASLSTGIRVGQWDLSTTSFENIYIPIPPKDEQDKIVEHIENKISYLDKIIDAKNQLITKIEEYKNSLLYEVVTGKKDV